VIASQFLSALERLNPEEQRLVAAETFRIVSDPNRLRDPGYRLERLERLKRKDLWSIRISRDLRAILYQHPDGTWIFLYVGHHDEALD
jgi:hypothetical protein